MKRFYYNYYYLNRVFMGNHVYKRNKHTKTSKKQCIIKKIIFLQQRKKEYNVDSRKKSSVNIKSEI